MNTFITVEYNTVMKMDALELHVSIQLKSQQTIDTDLWGIRNLIPSLGFLIVLMATNEDAVALGINGISLEHRLSREYFKMPYLRKII